MKKLLVPALAGGVVMWLLAGLWHEIFMAKFYANQAHAAHEGVAVIFAAYLVLGLLMSYLYPSQRKTGRPALDGLKLGVLVGLLWVFPHELAMAGAHGSSISYVFKNAAWHMIEQGIGGIIIGFVHARTNRGI
jgi:hypothetical protein